MVERFKEKTSIIAIALCMTLLCSVVAFSAPVARVIGANGEVEVKRAGSAEWVGATVQMELSEGDTIRTGEGRAALLYGNGSQIKMNTSSTMRIGSSESAALSMDLSEGELWTKIGNMGLTGQSAFEVRTPAGVVAVKGTEFDVLTDERGTSTLTVVEGKANFYNEHGSVMVEDSQQSTARPGSAPSPPKVVDFRNRIEWIADVYSLGLDIENPMVSQDPVELVALEKQYVDELGSVPDDPKKMLMLGRVYYDQHRYEEALEILIRADDFATEDYDIYTTVGQVHLELADTEEARWHFEEAAGFDPKRGEALTGVGLSYLKENKITEAEKALQSALKIEELPLTHTALAVVMLRQGEPAEARDHVAQALRLDQGHYQAYLALASSGLSRNRLVEAKLTARKAEALAPNSPAAKSLLAKALFFMGEPDEAFPIAVEAAEINPMAAFPQSVLADIYLQREDISTALQFALRAVALNPHDPFTHFSLARVENEAAQYKASMRSFKKAADLSPDFIRASAGLANLLAELNLYDEAIAEANRMIERRPDYAPPYNTLADVYFTAGRADESEENYKKAIELDPQSGQYHSNLAMLFIERNRMKDALDESFKAINLEPGNPWHHANMGYIYDRIDNEDLATHHFQKALELDPENSLAHLYFGSLMMNRAERYETIRKGLVEVHLATMEDPRVLKNTIRRGNTEVIHRRGSYDSSYTRFRHRFQEVDTKLNYYVTATQNNTNGHRINSKYQQGFRQLWVGYKHNQEKNYALFFQDVRQYAGNPGPTYGRDDEGDPDDSSLVSFSEVTFAYRYKPSRRTKFHFRAKTTIPLGANETVNEFPPNFPPEAVDQANDFTYFRYQQKLTETHLEGNYVRKWGKKNHELIAGIAAYRYKFDISRTIPVIDFDAETPYYYEEDTSERVASSHFAAYAQNTFVITPRLKLMAGLRRDGSTSDGNMMGFKLVLSRTLSSRSWLHLRYRKRLDTFSLVHHDPLEYWSAIDRLSEATQGIRGKLIEIDYERIFSNASFLKLTLFQFDEEKRTIYDTDTLENVTRLQAGRISYQRQLSSSTSFFLDYRYIPKKNRTPDTAYYGRYVAETNLHSGRIYINHLRRSGVGVQYEVIHNSDLYYDSENYRVGDGYFLSNLRLFYDSSLRRRYYLYIYNLFDEDHEFSAGNPEPGRMYTFGLSRYF